MITTVIAGSLPQDPQKFATMELRSRNSVHAFALIFILGFTSTTVADKEPAESPKEDSNSEKKQGTRKGEKCHFFHIFWY